MANIIYGMRADPEARDAEEVLNGCVGKGWVPILLELIDDLYALGWNGRVWQIKEKFGGLRFYIGDAPDAVHERIRKAEVDSYTICEVCGSPGHHRATAWERTLCDEHYQESFDYICE